MSDDRRWLHLYVALSRAARVRNALILRPPPRDLLGRGPPASSRTALEEFDEKAKTSRGEAEQLAAELGFVLPPA
eukprot:5733792-Pyramimonas_sp.AAC.1